MPRSLSFFRLSLTAAALAGLLAACGQPKAPETAGSGFGPLDSQLTSKTSDDWVSVRQGDKFTLTNSKSDNVARRIFLDVDDSIFGRRQVSVTVAIADPTERSRAGLVFGVRENAKDYYIYVLQTGNTVALYHRSERGQEELLNVRNDSIQNDSARLSIHEEGQRLSFLVNGQQAGIYDLPLPDRGAAGIIAWGRGAYTFSDFTHTPEPKAKSK